MSSESLEDKIEAIMRGNFSPTNSLKRNASNVLSEPLTPTSKAKLSFDIESPSNSPSLKIPIYKISNQKMISEAGIYNEDFIGDNDNNSLPLEYSDDDNDSNSHRVIEEDNENTSISQNNLNKHNSIGELIIGSELPIEEVTPQLLPWQQILLRLGVNPVDVKANPVSSDDAVSNSDKDRDRTVDNLLFGSDSVDSPIVETVSKVDEDSISQSQQICIPLTNVFQVESINLDKPFEVQLVEKDVDDEIELQRINSTNSTITFKQEEEEETIQEDFDQIELSQTLNAQIPIMEAVRTVNEIVPVEECKEAIIVVPNIKVIPNTEPKVVTSKTSSVKFSISPPRGTKQDDRSNTITSLKNVSVPKGSTVKHSTEAEAVSCIITNQSTPPSTIVNEKISPHNKVIINISPPRSARRESDSKSSATKQLVVTKGNNTPLVTKSLKVDAVVVTKESESVRQPQANLTPNANKRHSTPPSTHSTSRPKSNLKERHSGVSISTPEVKETKQSSVAAASTSNRKRNTTPSRYLDPKLPHHVMVSQQSLPDPSPSVKVTLSPKKDEEENIPTHEVRIAVRVRPFHTDEIKREQRRTISKIDSKIVIVDPKSFNDTPEAVAIAALTMNNTQWAQSFEFDECLWDFNADTQRAQYIDQKSVHKAIGLDLVEKALNGISCSCFAYGHTNTGKTYSLFGSNFSIDKNESKKSNMNKNLNYDEINNYKITSESGLIQRVFHDIISLSKNSFKEKHRVYISFLEIYNEKIRDLLIDNSNSAMSANSKSPLRQYSSGPGLVQETYLKLREHPSRGPYVENLTQSEVLTPDDAIRLITKGYHNRTTAPTIWNTHSSRSHAIVTLEIVPESSQAAIGSSRAKDQTGSSVVQAIMMSGSTSTSTSSIDVHANIVKVQMIDLAGSEKESLRDSSEESLLPSSVVWSGSRPLDSTPNKLVEILSDKEKNELKLIRRSLSTLGFIIKALSKGASIRTLPYRDSSLTFLLRDSLSGYCHTTMLATISPAHGCYEETLSTLRYADRLSQTNILSNKNHANSSSSSRYDNIVDKQLILYLFEKTHQVERYNNSNIDKNVEFSRNNMITNTQPFQPHIEKSKKIVTSESPHMLLLDTEILTKNDSNSKSNISNNNTNSSSSYLDDDTFVSPVSGYAKPLSDVNNADLDQLRSSYRALTSELLELQIDLDAVRTDRDMLKVELKGTKHMLMEIQESYPQNPLTGIQRTNSNSSKLNHIKTYEKENNEIQILLKRKDENIERLLKEIADEKQARFHAEQGYHARTKEFLGRFDGLKRENKELVHNLTLLKDKYQSFSEEKRDYTTQIEKLKSQVKILTQSKDLSTNQIEALRGETIAKEHKLEILKAKAKRTEELDKINLTITSQLEKCKSDIAIMTSERNSLVAMVEQKEKLLSIQNQQSEMSIKMLQQRQKDDHTNNKDHQNIAILTEKASKAEELEKVVLSLTTQLETCKVERDQLLLLQQQQQQSSNLSISVGDVSEPSPRTSHINSEVQAYAMKLQQNLSDLLTKEGEIIQSEIVDTCKLTAMIQDLRKQLTDSEKHKTNADILVIEKEQLNKQLYNVKQEYELVKMSVLALEQKVLISQQELQIAKNPAQQLEAMKIQNLLQSENISLKDQIIAIQNNLQHIKIESTKAIEDLQREYTTLWKSLQDLNKLDEQKDKSIKDIIIARDNALLEKRHAFEALAVMSVENTQLKQELEEIDILLLHAVHKGEYKLSPAGKSKTLMIQNVSDSVMSGVARRKNEVIKPTLYQNPVVISTPLIINNDNISGTRNNNHNANNIDQYSNNSNELDYLDSASFYLPMSPPPLQVASKTEANDVDEDSPMSHVSSIPTHSSATHMKSMSGYSNANPSAYTPHSILHRPNNLFSNLPPPQLPFEQHSSTSKTKVSSSNNNSNNHNEINNTNHKYNDIRRNGDSNHRLYKDNELSTRYHNSSNNNHDDESEFEYEENMSEDLLERQINELSGYLEDEIKLKRARNSHSYQHLTNNTNHNHHNNYKNNISNSLQLSLPTNMMSNNNMKLPCDILQQPHTNKNKALSIRTNTHNNRLRY